MEFNITELLRDIVYDNEMLNGEEIIVRVDNKCICSAEVILSEESIEFKIKF